MKVALILGPGWSRAAGYPEDLLDGPVYAATDASRRRVQAVLDAYRGPDHTTFLRAVAGGTVRIAPDPGDPSLFDVAGGRPLPYAWAVEAVALKLLRPDATGRREARLLPTRADFRTRDGGHLEPANHTLAHRAFLAQLEAEHELLGVVTTTCDTLIEGLLQARFHYGGLPRPQLARGAGSWEYYNDPDPERHALELDGEVVVCKLNGSVNWERDTLTIWRDMRLPSRDPATAAIDTRVASVEAAARALLEQAEHLIVVGTDAPPLATATPFSVDELAPDRPAATLSYFYGIHVSLAGDRLRVLYQRARAELALETLEVVDGAIPPRALALVREWAALHADELRAGPAGPIAPLD